MRATGVHLVVILLAGLLMYAHVSTAFFCGYDDFNETHRANFEDRREPARIFTTTHFESPKYRPLNRALTYLCWRLGGGSPLPFRLRNLLFHLIASLLVYQLAIFFTGDGLTALCAGLLFCLEPMVNQNVSAAIFTNTAAYAALLGSFLLFVHSARSKRLAPLTASLLLALTGVFLYESAIVLFGMMVAWLGLCWLRKEPPGGTWLKVWISGSLAVIAIFALVRHQVVYLSTPRAPLAAMVHNMIVYAAGLLSPVDPVLANALFGSALPPNINPSRGFVAVAAIGCAALLILAVLFLRTRPGREGLKRLDGGLIAFLILSALMALGPVLVFTPHASETYLYLPAAFYCILLSLFLRAFLVNKAAFVPVVSLLLILFCAGTWVRNDRVLSCGATARTILSSLPTARWTEGSWEIHLANMPGQPPPRRYGVYGYEGLSTIDPSEPGMPAAELALQVKSGNERLKADVVPPDEMNGKCTVPETCFEVSRTGAIREIPAMRGEP
jgi:hypothetical protein